MRHRPADGTSVAAAAPLADWSDDRSAPGGVLWWSRLDERYLVEARRLPANRVLLLAFDRERADLVVVRHVVALTGAAHYGPDPDDVRAWQQLVEAEVDDQ